MRAALAVAAALLAGCDRPPGPPVPLAAVVLHDVQGLHGGHALWATADGTAVVQVVTPTAGGLHERRYAATLSAGQWVEVERLAGAHHLPEARMNRRPAVPDEAHPIIVLVPRAGDPVRLCKRANDRHPDFDPVYAHLLALCRPAGDPGHAGEFDWNWRPPGFPRPSE